MISLYLWIVLKLKVNVIGQLHMIITDKKERQDG
jgi:hypothetical protein